MRSLTTFLLFFTASVWLGLAAIAQERPSTTADPRGGLKAGLKDPGVAARNLELVKSIPKPEGFFDPKSPLGTPIPAEQNSPYRPPAAAPSAQAEPPKTPTPAAQPAQPVQPPASPSGFHFA